MPKKIFELAKDFDMKPLDLVDKLKAEGFSVRNHMSSLTDEEIDKVQTLLKPVEEEPAKKKAIKKKAVRKKAAKKKVTKKAAASSDAEAGEEEKATKKTANKAVRRKTVVRRKSSKKDEEAVEAEAEVLVAAEEVTEAESTEEVVAASAAPEEADDDGSGLRVVSRPAAEKTEAESAEAKPSKEKDEVFKEKVHKFTPVFIPEKKAESEKSDNDSNDSSTSGSSSEDGDKKDSSKKRLGGLASMMSGKKAVVSKSQMLNQDRADTEMKSYAALSLTGRPLYTQVKRKKAYSGPTKDTEITEVKDSKRVLKLHNGATAEQLAKGLKVKLKELINKCLKINLLLKNGDYIGMQLTAQIAAMYDYRVENVAFDETKILGGDDAAGEEGETKVKDNRPPRNPIITVMGHVDHGKTTLIDNIRNASVVEGEAGGITQHIGAYSVDRNGKTITFLDTPGHAAFANMRQRGANVTDIVVLIVAADDGVMPQTKESVLFCQQAEVPVVVAVNKMDKEGVNPDRVKQELTEIGVTPEDWGGDTQFVPISALKGEGIDDLLEAILLQAEMLELRAEPKGRAEGVVIESKVEQGRGAVATVLVQSGTLKKGDSIVVGECYGRARQLTDHLAKALTSAGPSMPVQILGLNGAPSPGDSLNVVKNEREAKKVAQNRIDDRKKLENSKVAQPANAAVSLEDFFASASGGDSAEVKELNLIIRTDVQGSFEAIKQSLEALGNSEVGVKVISGGVGAISDSDVNLAVSASAIILGFNMRPVNTARRIAEQNGVDIKTYSIIYELLNDVTLALEGMLDPEYVEEFIGRAAVKETFSIPKVGVIAGCSVIDGKIAVGCNIRLLRNGKILWDGKMSSLKRFKDDVKEVKNGMECGIGLDEFFDIKANDEFEAYMLNPKKRSLEDVAKAEEIAAAKAAKEMEEAEAEGDSAQA
jgi:translation initiation factor IF-2